MILNRIVLKNFRCFYGKCEINFATDPKKNVTLIHAENGVGKTTILNALLWCFYKETTRRFELKESIVNHQAVKEGNNIASVEVYFEHNDEEFVAIRHYDQTNPSIQNTLKVAAVEHGTQVPQTHTAPETFINSVIPKDMAGHFLFDGEHAEAISGEENRNEVGDAVRDILGCTLATNAISDLDIAYKHYRKNATASTSDSTAVRELQERETALETQVTQAKEQIVGLEKELVSISTQASDINKYLRNSAAVKETQKRKEMLERSLVAAIKRGKDARQKVLSWLGDNGHYLVAKKITEETFSCLDDESTKGKIPAPYNKDFVSSLLEAEKCVCGHPLVKGSKEAELVAALLNTASTKVLQDRIIKVRARLEGLRENRERAPQRLKEANDDCSQEEEEVAKLEGQLAECRAQIKNVNITEISDKEVKLEQLRRDERTISQDIGGLRQNILRTERDKNDVAKQVDSLTSKNSDSKRYILRRDLALALKERLEVRLAEEEEVSKTVIRKYISEIMEATSRKNFKVRMDDNYTVTLRNADGIIMPKSEGENQLLGLAFTATLCKFAKIRKGSTGEFLLPGTEAPLVLDSPFGKLDSIYKVATAEFIPDMASQVILMVSKEQGSENVLAKLKDKIGEEYCLVRHNQSERGLKAQEFIDIGAKRVETTIYESTFDGTEIQGGALNVKST